MNHPNPEPDSELLQDIFADACDSPADQRETVLNARCGNDATLRQAVSELLAASDRAGRFMSDPQAAVERFTAIKTSTSELPLSIGEFKIVRLLGEGGFGTVYLAQQAKPVRREVALKVIKLGMDTQQVIARFEAERQALAMMDHPNIAKVFDAGATETGRPYFVMELVNGVPITEYSDTAKLTLRQRLELFIPVCLAVGHAHQKGIIHRDIKPSNVLVAVHDGKPVPKIIDFGVAKATSTAPSENPDLANPRTMLGTLEYMSPERIDQSERDVDTRSDIYSLGALLYELLTGKMPFDPRELREKNFAEVQRTLRETSPPRPSMRITSLSAPAQIIDAPRPITPRRLARALRNDLDWIILRCLEKDKQRRYQSAAALAEDIQRHLNNEPVVAGPATASYRTRKFIRRHKASVVVTAALLGGLLMAIAGTTTGMLRARVSQKQAEQSALQANLEAARANSVSDFMRGVFSLAQPESGAAGDEAKIGEVLTRTADEIDARLHGRPEEQVMARRMLAEACRRLMLYDLAVVQLRRAYDLSKSLPGQAHSERTLDLATELILECYASGKGQEIVNLARTTFDDCRKFLGEAHPITWKATNACALALSETGTGDETFSLLQQLVERIKTDPRAHNATHLARYQANLAVCLRDRGDEAGAIAAMRAAAQILKINRIDPALTTPGKPSRNATISTDELSAWMRGALDRDLDLAYSNAWINRQIVESGDFAEAVPFLEQYVAAAMALHPGGTPTLADRIYDIAMLKMRRGDAAGASAAFAHSIELRHALRGHDSELDQSRWRAWTLCQTPALYQNWRSPALRDHLWCALNDLLRDNPPQRLLPAEINLQRLQFKLFRWAQNADGESAELKAQGTIDSLRKLEEPESGLYLLSLEVPRLGDDPLKRACWLILAPWRIELRPIPRFDVARSLPSVANLDHLIPDSPPLTSSTANALAMDDGLAIATQQPTRLNWFTLRATTRLLLAQGMYRLSATADDGVRVWIDGQQVVDAWYPQASTTKDGVIELEAGEHEIKVEYFQQVGGYSLWLQLAPMSPPAKKAMLALGGGVPQLDSHIIVLRQDITEHPADQSLKTLHARATARRGRFGRAATELQEVTRLDPTNAQQAYLRAALVAYLGNQSEYGKVCRAMFERFSATHDEIARDALIKACSLGDKPPVDLAEFQSLIDRSNSDPSIPFTSGPANYQAARYDLAARQLISGLPAAHNRPTTLATAKLFLAMSLQKLGRHDEALAQWEAPQTSYPPRTAIGSGGCVGAAAGVLVAEVEWTGGECPVAFGCFGEASLSGMAVLPQNFLRFCQ